MVTNKVSVINYWMVSFSWLFRIQNDWYFKNNCSENHCTPFVFDFCLLVNWSSLEILGWASHNKHPFHLGGHWRSNTISRLQNISTPDFFNPNVSSLKLETLKSLTLTFSTYHFSFIICLRRLVFQQLVFNSQKHRLLT